jgi:hypothetical protein
MKIIKFACLVLIIAICIWPRLLLANDGSAAWTPDGLMFVKTDNISIEEENLYISMRQIRVEYKFKNNSNKNIETWVIFPLPSNSSETIKRKGSFFEDFTVYVDDRKVSYKVEVKRETYKKDNIWSEEKRYYWKQIFPANKTIKIFHSYRPQEGMYYVTYKTKDSWDPTWGKYDNFQEGYSWIYDVGYVLKTAKLWQGPIKRFIFTLDKDINDSIRFKLNGEQIKFSKGQARYQKVITNFVPNEDIQLEWYSNIDYRELIDGKKSMLNKSNTADRCAPARIFPKRCNHG